MKEITIQEALCMNYLLIDMVTPVKGYEKYDFHIGMKCEINGFPFELMSENGELSLEAGAIYLTSWKQKKVSVPKFKCSQTIAIIQLFGSHSKAFEVTLPKKVSQQSFTL